MRPQSLDTPPPAPRLFNDRQQRDDIGEAVAQGSMPHLMLALLSGHQCGGVLHEAVRHQHILAVQFVLERGHAPDEQSRGRRPLHMAIGVCASEGDLGHCMASMLLKHGACPNARPGDGGAEAGLLHSAAARGSAAAVRLLLENGADPNAKDPSGNAPLHYACRCPAVATDGADPVDPAVGLRLEVVVLLLRAGAAPAAADAMGRPPVALVQGFDAAASPSRDRLRAVLLGAERQWRRRGLAVLRAQLRLGRSERSACLDCFGGDESKCILKFL